MADPNELLKLVLANDAGFALYKRQHWERVFREQITPWLVAHDAEVRASASVNGSCWDRAPQAQTYDAHDPMPALCELHAGHLGAHKSGATQWMRGVVAEEPEWEYGYTSKWGTIAASSRADAEGRAAGHARGIAQRRESGDLKYHGKVVKRIAASKPGEWVPVEQGEGS